MQAIGPEPGFRSGLDVLGRKGSLRYVWVGWGSLGLPL